MDKANIDETSQARAPEHASPRRVDRGARSEPGDGPKRRRIPIERLREVSRNLGGQLDEQVHKRPYAVVGAAIGVGFVAGSLLGSRLGQVLLAAGIGYVVKQVVGGDLGIERIQATLEKMATAAERGATPS